MASTFDDLHQGALGTASVAEGVESGAQEWRVVGAAGGAQASGRRVRGYEVEATAKVRDGRLGLAWRYSGERQEAERMREVMGWWAQELRRMVEEWRGGGAPSPSPSDFPLTKLTNEQLGKVLSRIGKAKK